MFGSSIYGYIQTFIPDIIEFISYETIIENGNIFVTHVTGIIIILVNGI